MVQEFLAAERAEAAAWARDLLAEPFVVFDTETTGVGRDDEIVQIGLIDGDGVVLMDQLVKPTKPIPDEAAAIHGITQFDVFRQPEFREVYPALKKALADQRIVAYNADFDRKLLHQTCSRYGLPRINGKSWDCAMKQYARFRGMWNVHRNSFRWVKLTQACEHEGIMVRNAHAATGDCVMTLELLARMAEEAS